MTGSAFYRFDAGLYHPQQPATGSWNKSHQNGVAVGGLLTQVAFEAPDGGDMLVSRVSVDILGGVPFAPLRAEVDIEKQSASMQLVRSRLWCEDRIVAMSSMLKVRMKDTPSGSLRATELPAPEISGGKPVTSVLGKGHPMETCVVAGSPRTPGPGAYWTKFNAALISGRPTASPAQVVMTADIASAPSSVLDNQLWTYANLDLSIYLNRYPEGEWVLAEARTDTVGTGTALTSSVLFDRQGEFGRAHQTLFVAPRG